MFVSTPVDQEFGERPAHFSDGLVPCRRECDELCDHRIVIGRDIHIPDRPRCRCVSPGPPGMCRDSILPGDGPEIKLRVFGVDAALDGVAADFDIAPACESGSPAGDEYLLLSRCQCRHQLGDGMLHLDAGVHLHEIKIAVLVHEKFDGPGVFIVAGLRQASRRPCPSSRAASAVIKAEGASSSIFWLRRWRSSRVRRDRPRCRMRRRAPGIRCGADFR